MQEQEQTQEAQTAPQETPQEAQTAPATQSNKNTFGEGVGHAYSQIDQVLADLGMPKKPGERTYEAVRDRFEAVKAQAIEAAGQTENQRISLLEAQLEALTAKAAQATEEATRSKTELEQFLHVSSVEKEIVDLDFILPNVESQETKTQYQKMIKDNVVKFALSLESQNSKGGKHYLNENGLPFVNENGEPMQLKEIVKERFKDMIAAPAPGNAQHATSNTAPELKYKNSNLPTAKNTAEIATILQSDGLTMGSPEFNARFNEIAAHNGLIS